MEFFKKTPKIRFMALRRRWYALSLAMVLGSILLVAFNGLNLAIDFTGGVVVEVGFDKDVDLEDARRALAEAGLDDAQVQNFGTARDVLVRLPPAEASLDALTATVVEAMRSLDPGVKVRRTEAIGPQVGAELAWNAALAILFTLIFVLLYIALRFKWRFGIGAIVASLHDPIVALGVIAVVGLPFDLTVVAALLTVLGYSVNDTVVVFDRVRERFYSLRKASPPEVMDLAVNETLSRTIITAGTALSSVLALLIFGGDALRGFSLTLAVGIVVGTYSSIYVANAIALDLGASQKDFLTHEERKETDGLP